jgi:hypothetical protein
MIDVKIVLGSIPTWISPYLTSLEGCSHTIVATFKVRGSEAKYKDFTKDVCSALLHMRCNRLEKVFSSFVNLFFLIFLNF